MPVFQLTSRQLLFQERVTNIYYIFGDTLSYSDGTGVAQIFAGEMESGLANFRHQQWGIDNYDWRQVDQPGFPSQRVFPASTHNGNSVDEPTPYQASLLVGLGAPTLKPNKARKYLCGFTEADTTAEAVWSAALRTAAAATFQSILGSLEGQGWDLVTAQWDPTNTFVEEWNTLVNVGVRTNIYTQRRRVPEVT